MIILLPTVGDGGYKSKERTQGFKAAYQNVPLHVKGAYNILLRCMCWQVGHCQSSYDSVYTKRSARPSVKRR